MSLFLSGFGSLQDQKLFREDGGWELVDAVAQYWCSRMVWSEEEQCYHIRGTSATARPVCREEVSEQRLGAPVARPGQECMGSSGSCPLECLTDNVCVHANTRQDAQLSSSATVPAVFSHSPLPLIGRL